MDAIVALLLGFYLGGVACSLQWGFVIEDQDGVEVPKSEMRALRLKLALLWFWRHAE